MITNKMFISELCSENEEEVSKALHDVSGVQNVIMNTAQNEVEVTYSENTGGTHELEQVITDLGYDVKRLK